MARLKAEEIRTIIAQIMYKGDDIGMHPESLAHWEGLLRGLIWSLTGKDPGNRILTVCKDVFELSGISYKDNDDGRGGTFDLDSKYAKVKRKYI